tara:strand:- start:3651 stop:4001 length:351 start_codon:yes stop_codon:yes gene_type:complete
MAGSSNEQAIQNRIRMSLSRGAARLFRNNTGALKDANGRPIFFGLCKGSSDLIGWKTIEIKSEDVGKKVAVFCAIEVKDKAKATPLQRRFLEVVSEAGGFAGIARSVNDAKRIIGM